MALTKRDVVTLLRAAKNNPATSPEILKIMNDLESQHPRIFGVSKGDEMDRVERFLRRPSSDWDPEKLYRVVSWIFSNWKDIPSGGGERIR